MAKETAIENEGWCSMTRSYPLTDTHRLSAYRTAALPTKGHGRCLDQTRYRIRCTTNSKTIGLFLFIFEQSTSKAVEPVSPQTQATNGHFQNYQK